MEKAITLSEAYKVMFTEYPDIVCVSELCEMLGGIGRKEAYRLLQSGHIEYLRSGKGYKIPKLSVLAYLLS